MAFNLTDRARALAEQTSITPQLLLEIEGIDDKFTTTIVKRFILVGEPDLVVGVALPGESEVWRVGGQRAVEAQDDLISFQAGTSTEIRQSLNIDKGTGETVSSMQIALVDKDLKISQLITPGNKLDDLLSVKVKLWLGFAGGSWRDDFIVIFRGIIDDIDAGSGLIKLNIAHPDQKKRAELFTSVDTEVSATVLAGDTTIDVDSTAGFLAPIAGPAGIDPALTFYARINDEIFKYTSINATQFLGVTRGQLGTVAAGHSIDDGVTSLVRLTGNSVDLALKLMLSGVNGDFIEDIEVSNFVNVGGGTTVDNAIYFAGVDVFQQYGFTAGDYITTTGATNGANNFSGRQIVQVVKVETGSYITVDGAALVLELDTDAVLSARSAYDTLGYGLQMAPDEVDITRHLEVKSQFLSSFDYDFYIKDTINGREFITDEIYNPASAFSLPRKSQASIGVHIPPLPTVKIKTLNSDNILNPSELKIKRTISKNFFNTIVYRFEQPAVEDRFLNVKITQNNDSLARIKVGTKALQINSAGMRSGLQAGNLATLASQRRLKKYKFAAESILGIKCHFSTAFDLEIGDIVLIDIASLQITDINTATREGDARLFEITNKKLNFKNGKIILDVVDTNFDRTARYGLISMASNIQSGLNTTQFVINQGWPSEFGADEFKKWSDFVGAGVKIRSVDYTVSDVSTIKSISGNLITLDTALAFTPSAGYLMELDEYDKQTDLIKALYVAMQDNATFSDGGVQYQML